MPRLITYQRKRANRRVLNEDELIALLKNYGELQVLEMGDLMVFVVDFCL